MSDSDRLAEDRYQRKSVEVLGARMAYVDAGQGDPGLE